MIKAINKNNMTDVKNKKQNNNIILVITIPIGILALCIAGYFGFRDGNVKKKHLKKLWKDNVSTVFINDKETPMDRDFFDKLKESTLETYNNNNILGYFYFFDDKNNITLGCDCYIDKNDFEEEKQNNQDVDNEENQEEIEPGIIEITLSPQEVEEMRNSKVFWRDKTDLQKDSRGDLKYTVLKAAIKYAENLKTAQNDQKINPEEEKE